MSNKIEKQLEKIQSLRVVKIEHFQYSKIAKIPFKIHAFVETMNCRMIDFCESINILLNNNHVVPSLSLIRGLFENISLINIISQSVNSSLKQKKLVENFDEIMTNLTFGTRYDDNTKAINILTQLKKLDRRFSCVSNYYDAISEFVHPNWDGVQGSYSMLDKKHSSSKIYNVVNMNHEIYAGFENCFILCMSIYFDITTEIKNNLPDFAMLCENEISSITKSQ